MPHHFIEKTMPYTRAQLFALVSDVESYPKFIPWCEGARVWDKKDTEMFADLIIYFKGISGKFTSHVKLDRAAGEITVELAQGPFKHLYQSWKFTDVAGGTMVEFDIDFAMRSKIIEKIIDVMFDDLCIKMMDAFEKQAEKLYHKKP